MILIDYNNVTFIYWLFHAYRIDNAHDAGISCLLLAKDNENNSW